MRLTRRSFLATCASLPAVTAVAADAGLGALAARSGRYFGAAVSTALLTDGSAFVAPLDRDCSVWVPEWQLKWGALTPAITAAVDFTAMDGLVAAARTAGKRMRGHTLIWHEHLPDGIEALDGRGGWDSVVVPHIQTVAGHYRDAVFEWDVVNEAIEPRDGGADLMRRTPFYRMLGPDYVAEAFRLAAEAAPSARLYLNEDHLYYDDEAQQARRVGLLALLERLVRVGVPVHGVGLQCHLDIRRRFDGRLFNRFLDEVTGLGLSIAVTELDVREHDDAAGRSLARRRQRAADEVTKVLEGLFDRPALAGVTTWGISDADSWLRKGEQGGDNQGLPYGDAFQPTPMRAALAALFTSTRTRHD